MTTSTDPLLNLVSTMTKQEKRYFKLYSTFYNKEHGNNTLRLFEFIEKNKLDGTRLAQAVQQEPYARQLAFLKNHLTEQILDSLMAYEASKSTVSQLQRNIAHAEVLTRRGLYTHAKKILMRAEKKASHVEEYPLLMDIFYRMRSLLIKNTTPTFEQDLQNLYEQEKKILKRMQAVSICRRQMDRMQIIAARYSANPTANDRKEIETIVSQLRAVEKEQILPFSARLAIYSTLGMYAFLVNDSVEAMEQYRNVVHLWKEYPDMIQEQPERYYRYLLNFLSSLVSVGTLEEFTAITRELRGNTPNNKLKGHLLKDLWILELMFYLNRGLPDRCADVIVDIERHRSSGELASVDAASLITLYHNCSVYYFIEGRFSRCLDYINILQTETHDKLKRDVQAFSRIFSVVAHYELKNLDILDNLIRSAKRYLKKNSASGRFEKTVMAGIRVIITAVDNNEQKEAFTALHNNLLVILHTESQEPLGITELLFWTESYIQNCPLRDLFIQKIQNTAQPSPHLLFPLPQTMKGG